jgi:protein SCO1/2
MVRWLSVLAGLMVVSAGVLIGVRLTGPSPLERAERLAHGPQTGAALFAAPPFELFSHRGQVVSSQTLKGKVYVANFIFTTCRTVCPLMTARMVQLQRALREAPVEFISFSVDPRNDTAEALRRYAESWAPDESRWQLLVTDERSLAAVAGGFHITARPNEPGAVDAVMHSSVFVVVDGSGAVRGVFESDHPGAVKEMERAVRALAMFPAPPPRTSPAEAIQGVELYHAWSCANCHENAELAPKLRGRAGQRVQLENGIVVQFDAAYVKESILAPDAKRTRGYPLRMPSYDATAAQVAALTEYLLASPRDGDEEPVVETETDPVCRMRVRPSSTALSSEVSGKRYFFCSRHCQERFEASPAMFLADGGH